MQMRIYLRIRSRHMARVSTHLIKDLQSELLIYISSRQSYLSGIHLYYVVVSSHLMLQAQRQIFVLCSSLGYGDKNTQLFALILYVLSQHLDDTNE